MKPRIRGKLYKYLYGRECMTTPKNPFYGRTSNAPKAELRIINRVPLTENIQKAKKANLITRIEYLKKKYCVCSWHKNGNRYVHRITGNIAPKWVEKMLKDEPISHSMCIPCFIQEYGVDKAIEDFGVDVVHKATRNMVLR